VTGLELVAAVLLLLGSALVIRAVVAADTELDDAKRSPAKNTQDASAPRLGRAA
jgi:hypothetical protein